MSKCHSCTYTKVHCKSTLRNLVLFISNKGNT